jgi:hypothetical protein
MIIGFIMAILGTYYLWWGPDSTITLSGIIAGIGLILIIASLISIGFSMAGLGGLSYMLYRRLEHLRENTRTAFVYLLTREAYLLAGLAIKIEDEVFENKLSSGKRGAGLDSPFATLLLIALPDFVIAVGCHSEHSFDSMV